MKPTKRTLENSHRFRGFLAVVVLVAAGLVCSSATAATVLRLDMQSLVANSDKIVYGTVESVESRLEKGRVYTYTSIKVDQSLKGDPGESLMIRQLGGETEELATWVAGMPRFSEGEQVITFVEETRDEGYHVVTGMMQGKFDVVVGPDGATRHVVPYLGDISLVDRIEPAGGVPGDSGSDADNGEVGPQLQSAEPSDLYRSIKSFDFFMERIRTVVRDQQDIE
ncbi:MAG: hypothetical protein ACQEVA_14015 [Myxococcota bacterium]